MFFREKQLLLAYAAAFFHEFAHMTCAISLGFPPLGAEVSVFGLRLFIPLICSTKKRLAVYVAGPFASLLIFLFLCIAGRFFCILNPLYRFFTYANFYIGLINLVPVFPLDGAILLRTAVSSRMGIIRSSRICRAVSVFFFGFILGLNFLFITGGKPNLSLFMILLFLIMSIKSERNHSLAEKKAVLSGDIKSKAKIRYLACDAKSELLCLAGYISYDYSLLVAVFKGERFYGEICQSEIIDGINNYGALCNAEEYIGGRQ